ncbi:MAG: YbaK/EbsC family protein [Oscillospiraceae bacterium]
MSVELVRGFLQQKGYERPILEFSQSSATVELAALAVGVEAARIAKTLSLHDAEGCMLLVVAGDAKIDNSAFKKRFGMKARMLTHEEALSMTGHAVGGVCPFALPEGTTVWLDESLQRFETVFPAAGSDNSAIELSPCELARLSGGRWVDVCKGWRENTQSHV